MGKYGIICNMTMTIGDFVKKKKHLFWSTRNYDGLSPETVVEGILNYGDMNDVKELIALFGMHDVAKIFRAQTNRPRINYDPKVAHYFSLFFQKYAP